ncbi:hypothetical protein [Undibacterium luofuense]|uniref:Uncharacterized protein n=1 Tax=Undibacterium luofuense TaxID=2828733 RepID=A0A941DM38_9BURK|nr:hypothetical protein [Undibacterium luofuense]MBR7781266.1 hypothetical protein [Undibacterium luofuense]
MTRREELTDKSPYIFLKNKTGPHQSRFCFFIRGKFSRYPAQQSATDYAELRITLFRRSRLSADDRRIAVLNTAFGAFSGLCGVV